MQKVSHDFLFSTAVSDNTDVNEFIIEFFEDTEEFPIKITRNFDELLDFLEKLDEN